MKNLFLTFFLMLAFFALAVAIPNSNYAGNDVYINFTLQNTGAKSIPLIIPSVMNPNLSPFSKSGVSLKIGQKVFFKENGKKYLLLEVDESIEEGSVLNVNQLLKARREALELK